MEVDLSLDEIIKKKRIGDPAPRKYSSKRRSLSSDYSTRRVRPRLVTDARTKIIQRNRAKIRDARDKLVEITRVNGDARQRIAPRIRRNIIATKGLNGRLGAPRRKLQASLSSAPYTPLITRVSNLIEIPRGYVDYDNMDRLEQEEYASGHLSHISRTVHNDVEIYDVGAPPAPRRIEGWGTEAFDPFEVYDVPHSREERSHINGSQNYHRRVRDMSPDIGNHRQRTPPLMFPRRYVPEHSSHLSYKMRSRLEQAPDPHASMGIFANPVKQTPPTINPGSRIVVSNLHTSVTQSDIKELFEDIGELYESRIVRPGVAEVIYKNFKDAEKAVDTYHNRQLDGQPMKCLLVNPRSSSKPTASALKNPGSVSNSRLSSGKTPLEIDIDALHKVLFRRH